MKDTISVAVPVVEDMPGLADQLLLNGVAVLILEEIKEMLRLAQG